MTGPSQAEKGKRADAGAVCILYLQLQDIMIKSKHNIS